MKKTFIVKWPRTVTGTTMSTATAITCLAKAQSEGLLIAGEAVDLRAPSDAEERDSITKDAIESLTGAEEAAASV